MRVSILIVISAIVVLVIALVLLTVFSQGIGNIYTITGAQSQCASIGRSTCSTSGSLPANWAIPSMRVSETGETQIRSCGFLMLSQCKDSEPTKHTCGTCSFPGPGQV